MILIRFSVWWLWRCSAVGYGRSLHKFCKETAASTSQTEDATSGTWTEHTIPHVYFFLCWRAPQQKLRTHRSLYAYCATLWWRWRERWSFFSPRVMEHRWNETGRGKPKHSGKKLSQCHFVHHKSHMDWPRDRTRASAVGGRRLTAWASAGVTLTLLFNATYYKWIFVLYSVRSLKLSTKPKYC
jgi:hypothetical protein